MEVVATAKWVRTTARKARLVSAMVTGLPVAEALVVLRYSPRSAAVDIAKVIKSAAANAEHNYNLDASSLRVARVEVDGAMIIKRWRAKPRGMAGRIFKRTVVPAPVVTPVAATTPAASADAPAARPRPARSRAPKPTTEEAE